MEIKQFKIRCSAISQIMTNPRAKSETISKTCKSYCEQWLKEQLYETQKEINSKYLSKGVEVESLAIDYYAENKGLGFVLQNTESFEDDFMTGTPDLIHKDEIIEIKSSWDCFTFPLFETQIKKDYWMQCQGYMALTGLRKSKLVYTLQNTPDELEYNEPVDYESKPAYLRIKEFEIEYDPKFIESVAERVELCRDYIEGLILNLNAV
jgi:hypothetical protein